MSPHTMCFRVMMTGKCNRGVDVTSHYVFSCHDDRKLILRCGEGGEKLGPVAPFSRHRGGLSDRVHLDGRSKISKQAAGCKNRPKPYPAGSGPQTASEALQTFRQ